MEKVVFFDPILGQEVLGAWAGHPSCSVPAKHGSGRNLSRETRLHLWMLIVGDLTQNHQQTLVI